jgi:uncharacterized protein (DUF2267 family)
LGRPARGLRRLSSSADTGRNSSLRESTTAAVAGRIDETWHPTEPIPFVEREALNREVQAYHADHQFASEHAIDEIASVVWRHVDQPRLQRALDHLPAQAAAFWNRSRPTKSSEASQ